MSPDKIHHALGLHMHQPPGNMRLLIDHNEWEAIQIIHCYDRATRYAHKYIDHAKFHVGFSGVLLEQLRDPDIVDRYRQHLDIPAMLNSYREANNIELIGMGFYHPIFPLLPKEDWADQLIMGRQILEDTFGRAPKGFWPSEMAFTMEMIPALVKAGYEYVVVDSVHVKSGEDSVVDIYRPYRARHGGAEITVIPRDRDISNAQESGLDPTWFANEARHRASASPNADQPRLLTTWSDGENGGWFRQMDEGSGFFGHFFAPYVEHAQGPEYPVRPVAISDFLRDHQPEQEVEVKTGAWNVGHTSGEDFSQWNGSESQKQAVKAIQELSHRYREVKKGKRSAKAKTILEPVHHLVLEAETSCFLFWGDAWLPKLYERTAQAHRLLDELEQPEVKKAEPAPSPAPPVKPATTTAKPAAKIPPARKSTPAKAEAETAKTDAATTQPVAKTPTPSKSAAAKAEAATQPSPSVAASTASSAKKASPAAAATKPKSPAKAPPTARKSTTAKPNVETTAAEPMVKPEAVSPPPEPEANAKKTTSAKSPASPRAPAKKTPVKRATTSRKKR